MLLMRDIGGFPVSELAMPMIRPDEAMGAPHALCPAHGSQLTHLNEPGAVLFCPAGMMYWRASKGGQGMHSRLSWPKGM
jgi:hypothetical protein